MALDRTSIIDKIAQNPSSFGDYIYLEKDIRSENGKIDLLLKQKNQNVFSIVKVKVTKANRRDINQLMIYMSDYSYLNKLEPHDIEGILVAPEFSDSILKIQRIFENIKCYNLDMKKIEKLKKRSRASKKTVKAIVVRDYLEILLNDTLNHLKSEVKRGDMWGAYEVYKAVSEHVYGDTGTMNVLGKFLVKMMANQQFDDDEELTRALDYLIIKKPTI